jgi:DNA-binding FrmR family transcriptional regulator
MTHQREKVLINFKKTRSLMDKLITMVESDEYCVKIMQQNLAALGLLKSAHQMLMENHLNTCFKAAMQTASSTKKQTMIDEILAVTKLIK